jgi:ferredoxin
LPERNDQVFVPEIDTTVYCSEVCPKVFELGDDQKSTVIGPDKCITCNCQEAIDTCPVQAINWSE